MVESFKSYSPVGVGSMVFVKYKDRFKPINNDIQAQLS